MNTLCKYCGKIIKIENFYYITNGEKSFMELYKEAEDKASDNCECCKK